MGRTIAIAGAGIAGLAAAAILSDLGNTVSLYDKSPAPAPVGSGLILQPVGLAVLAALGCSGAIARNGAAITRLFGRVIPSNRIVLDVGYGPASTGKHGIAVHRATLFQALLDAAGARDVSICHDCDIAAAETRGGAEWLVMSDGRVEGPFDMIVDALGARSPLAPPGGRDLTYGALWASLDWPLAGFDPHTLEQRYEYASCMVGVLPIGRMPGGDSDKAAFFWSLRQQDYRRWCDTPLDQWKDDVLRVWPQTGSMLDQVSSHGQMVMARYRHCTLTHPVSGRIVHLGDSFHATSPQLGQGANMALLDAWALGAALQAQPELDAALNEYARLRSVHVKLYQLVSLLFTPFYQSDSKALAWLRDHVLAPVSRLAPVQRLLSGLVAGELGMPLHALGLSRSDRSLTHS